jgi:cytochrome P450
VGFYIGNEPQVAIADFDLMKDVMKREETASRPKSAPFQDLRPGGTIQGILDKENSGNVPGIIFSSGKAWADQRRFTLRVLRDFGFGKSSMEDTLLDEVDKLCERIKKVAGSAVNPGLKMNISILNALWAMLTGEKLPLSDPKLRNIVEKFNAFFTESSNPSSAMASMFPHPQMIRWRIFKPIRNALGLYLDSLHTSIFEVAKLCEEQIKRHEANLDEDNINDFIDAYLVEMKKNQNNSQSSFYKDRGHYNLVNSLIDLFFAGMETTSSALTWTFLLLLHHPDIKRKLQKEIDTVQILLLSKMYYFSCRVILLK